MQGQHFAAELKKTNRIDYRDSDDYIWNRKVEKCNLAKSSHAAQLSSAGPGGEKGASTCKRGTFEATEGGFWEIRSTKIEKSCVFRGQEALFPEVSLPKWRAHRPQAKKEGG